MTKRELLEKIAASPDDAQVNLVIWLDRALPPTVYEITTIYAGENQAVTLESEAEIEVVWMHN